VHCNPLGLVTRILKGNWNSLSLLKLSHNSLETATLNTLLPKILQTPLSTLHISSNPIGDAGCQLVAASLSSLSNLQHLDISFCQISSKGISSLSRSALGCETLAGLTLAGNSIRTQAAISLAYMLAHHPRLSKLTVDNCSLCKVAQCYLAAGIASNRWVPMKQLTGFKVGPPLVEIGGEKGGGGKVENVTQTMKRGKAK
jgi:Ran GTPase-activating protein (RanGAP) involved in mRNA processing and transport